MKQTTEKVYRCDHCNRPMVSAGLMKIHERMCKMNPNNDHKCLQWCKHLVCEKEEIIDDYGDISGYGKSFYCEKTEEHMYSYKLERFKHNEGRIKGLKRMPLECNDYEDKDFHE